jgi:hypothetical protein
MSEVLIIEFSTTTPELYGDVNKHLGLDPATGAGDWPAGLQTHVAASSPAGTSRSSRFGTPRTRRRSS